jgi:protein-S-isoprenylcysteine O-methyltransferase Ste14
MTDKKKSQVLVTIQFILLAVIFFLPVSAPAASTPSWILELGSFIVWPGLGMVLISIFKLGQSLTTSPIPKEDSELKTDGLYKWIRHPIYTGLIITTLGIALEVGSVGKLFFVAGLIVLFNYKAKWEESLLLERYPEYRTYMSKTGRFVPRLNR